MPKTAMRKCPSCTEWFYPDRYNAYQQTYCTKPRCQAASRQASREKRSAKNPDHFRGTWNVERVQQWCREHPGYWRRGRRCSDTSLWRRSRKKGDGRFVNSYAYRGRSAAG